MIGLPPFGPRARRSSGPSDDLLREYEIGLISAAVALAAFLALLAWDIGIHGNGMNPGRTPTIHGAPGENSR